MIEVLGKSGSSRVKEFWDNKQTAAKMLANAKTKIKVLIIGCTA